MSRAWFGWREHVEEFSCDRCGEMHNPRYWDKNIVRVGNSVLCVHCAAVEIESLIKIQSRKKS